MERRLRFLAGGSAGILGVVALALGLGILVPFPVPVPLPVPVSSDESAQAPARIEEDGSAPQRILLLSGPIHTDIALPATRAVRDAFNFLSEAGLPIERPDVAYVVVGWGGRSFYLETPSWADVKPLPVLRSFTSDASVLHVELTGAIDEGEPGTRDGVRPIDLDAAAFRSLVETIGESFSRDGSERPIAIAGSGYGRFDRFFEAEGRFNALFGCNVWTGRMLRAAGIATGVWTPLPQTLLWSLDLHG